MVVETRSLRGPDRSIQARLGKQSEDLGVLGCDGLAQSKVMCAVDSCLCVWESSRESGRNRRKKGLAGVAFGDGKEQNRWRW